MTDGEGTILIVVEGMGRLLKQPFDVDGTRRQRGDRAPVPAFSLLWLQCAQHERCDPWRRRPPARPDVIADG
jgi:hypothetical protein